MSFKEKIITIIITLLTLIILLFTAFGNRLNDNSKMVYQVYLNGEKLGIINNQADLLNMINEDQSDIKNQYKVDNVYPPNGFKIEKYKTYDNNLTSVKDIYNKVKESGDFTIKGYAITITTPKKEEEEEKRIVLNVINETIFKDALETLVTAFVEDTDYKNYIKNNQSEIETVGQLIKNMYFEERITIKETNISIKEKIYTNSSDLGQYLLFGKEKTDKSYEIKKGDTISSIAEDNKLNAKEFLIANPRYKSVNSLLAIGETVSVDLINPVLTLVQELHTVEDNEQVFEKQSQEDKTKSSDYNEVTQAGVTGIVRTTQEVKVVNGERNQGTTVISSVTLREVVNEITTVGKKQSNGTGSYWNTGKDWGWTTNRPYIITSYFEWRWGSFHDAIDISGPGFNSPIYAAKAGKVVETNNNCPNYGYLGSWCGQSYGNYVILDNGNNTYSIYAHMTQNLNVSVGQNVSRGEIIGSMGDSGSSSGTHLHFGISIGYPNYPGSRWINPFSVY